MDRAIKHHKRIGRLFYAFVCIHVVCMLAGGTEKGPVTWSKSFNLNEHNLWPGVVAFAAWTGQYVTSLPWFRRHHFEHFYFLHLNFMFVGNMFTIFHNRFRAVVWVIPAFAFFWLDFGVRWYTKMCKKASIVEYEIVDENLVKLVVRREGFPGAAFDFHPGSYIWLSVDVPADKRSEYMRDDIIGPPAFPVIVPSWVWFHPITVSSFDPETSHLTLFIKRFAGADRRGDGLDEWSGQLVHTMKAVRDAKMKLEDVRVHIGVIAELAVGDVALVAEHAGERARSMVLVVDEVVADDDLFPSFQLGGFAPSAVAPVMDPQAVLGQQILEDVLVAVAAQAGLIALRSAAAAASASARALPLDDIVRRREPPVSATRLVSAFCSSSGERLSAHTSPTRRMSRDTL